MKNKKTKKASIITSENQVIEHAWSLICKSILQVAIMDWKRIIFSHRYIGLKLIMGRCLVSLELLYFFFFKKSTVTLQKQSFTLNHKI